MVCFLAFLSLQRCHPKIPLFRWYREHKDVDNHCPCGFPSLLSHAELVSQTAPTTSYLVVKAPGGGFFSEILNSIWIFFLKALLNPSVSSEYFLLFCPCPFTFLLLLSGLFSLLCLVSGWSCLSRHSLQTSLQLPPVFARGPSFFQHRTSVCLLDISNVLVTEPEMTQEDRIHVLLHKILYFLISVNSRSFSRTSEKMTPISLGLILSTVLKI